MTFFGYALLDGVYLGVLYLWGKFIPQAHYQDSRLVRVGAFKRYLCYGIISLLDLVLSTATWSHVFLWFLSFPELTCWVASTAWFGSLYHRVGTRLRKMMVDSTLVLLGRFLNFVVRDVLGINWFVSASDLDPLYSSLTYESLVGVVKLVATGLAYDYYQILLFKRLSAETIQRYKKEVVRMVRTGRIGELIRFGNLRKVMIVYQHTDSKEIYDRVLNRLVEEVTRACAYWSFLSFALQGNQIAASVGITLLVRLVEGESGEVVDLCLSSLLVYLSPSDLASVLYLLYFYEQGRVALARPFRSWARKLRPDMGFSLIVLACGIFSGYSAAHAASLLGLLYLGRELCEWLGKPGGPDLERSDILDLYASRIMVVNENYFSAD